MGLTTDDFEFVEGEQEVSWRVVDPDGNVVDEGIGRLELEMTTQMGDGDGGN